MKVKTLVVVALAVAAFLAPEIVALLQMPAEAEGPRDPVAISSAMLERFDEAFGRRPFAAVRIPTTFAAVEGCLRPLESPDEPVPRARTIRPGLYAVTDDGPAWLERVGDARPIPIDSWTLVVVATTEFEPGPAIGTMIQTASRRRNRQPNPTPDRLCQMVAGPYTCAVCDARTRTCEEYAFQPEGEGNVPIACQKRCFLPRLPNEDPWW